MQPWWNMQIEKLQAENNSLRAEVERLTEETRFQSLRITDKDCEVERLRAALSNLYATVKGECPRLLNEDSGGDGRLCLEIESLLATGTAEQPATCVSCGEPAIGNCEYSTKVELK